MSINLRLHEEPRDRPTVMTALMRRTVGRTLAAMPTGGLVVWAGRSRIGKTTTAEWLVRELERTYDPTDPRTFRGLHFEVGEIRAGAGNEQKRAIAGLHYQLVRAPVSDGEYRRLPPEGLAERAVGTLRRTGRRLLFIDEAGNYSLQAIRGMVLVRDVAEMMGWPITIVFVGMDDLPTKIEQLEQIRNRVHAWCYFAAYNLAETRSLLAELHPHFRARAQGGETAEEALAEEVDYIHEQFGGYLGNIIPFLQQVDAYATKMRQPISLPVLVGVRKFLVRDRDRTIEDAAHGFAQRVTPAKKGDSTKAQKQSRRPSRASAGAQASTSPEVSTLDARADDEPDDPSTSAPALIKPTPGPRGGCEGRRGVQNETWSDEDVEPSGTVRAVA